MSDPGQMSPWSEADARGVRTRHNARRTRRERRADRVTAITVSAWPNEWKTLAARWLRSGGSTMRGPSIFKAAGNARHLALDVMEALLEAGYADIEEKQVKGGWLLHRLSWIDADGLRETLGLRRKDDDAAAREEALSGVPVDARIAELHASLSGKPTNTVLARAALVRQLDAWLAEKRTGTRQQFAHFARGDTKSLSTSEWLWLSEYVDLEGLGISRHTPAFHIRAPFQLKLPGGVLDLRAVPDVLGLSPETIRSIVSIEGPPCRWLLVENRTSFEEVARKQGDRDAVVWLPGFAPEWWLEAMAALLAHHGGTAHIAADPDPAGIDIALRAGALWDRAWLPWAMSAEALRSIARTKPLNAHDHARLTAQASQHAQPVLHDLAAAMQADGRKGEQEALDLLAWLPSEPQ